MKQVEYKNVWNNFKRRAVIHKFSEPCVLQITSPHIISGTLYIQPRDKSLYILLQNIIQHRQGHLSLAAVSTEQGPRTFPSWPPFPSLCFNFVQYSKSLVVSFFWYHAAFKEMPPRLAFSFTCYFQKQVGARFIFLRNRWNVIAYNINPQIIQLFPCIYFRDLQRNMPMI